jgi:glycosyltransferase involved in cell wall biosynthesis
MRRVLIIEAQIKQYRLPFYQRLLSILKADDIELKVGYSDPSKLEASKNDSCDLPPDYGIKVPAHWLAGERLMVQPLLRPALTADMVIVDQANKFLLNYLLLPLSRMSLRRVAFWGLGENRQEGRLQVSEWIRRKTLNWVSWWFAYTEGTRRYLVANGVPAGKITSVDNAVDTWALRAQMRRINPVERIQLRRALGISASAPVGIFCGMLDKVKSVRFLLESAQRIQARVQDFHLIIVGGGPDRPSVEAAARELPWIHMMGPRFGQEKAELIAISDAFLMPGRVGLVVLDAFAGGLPLLSTRLAIHGPELDYLEVNSNGLLCEPDVPAFADMATSLLLDRNRLARLQAGARTAGSRYTIENMAENFRTGIHGCLESAPDSAAVTA